MNMLKEFENISGISRIIMKAGTILAVLLVLASVITITLPDCGLHEIVLSEQMCTTAVTIFAEAIVFGIIGTVLKERQQ